MTVAQVVGSELVRAGIDHVFGVVGVVGSGNFEVTNAMITAGARYFAARHEGGAATMADAYARMSAAGIAAVSLHQGCGLTNAMTGIAEAAKSRTSLVVISAEANDPTSNFYVDQSALAEAVGAISMRVDQASEAAAVATQAAHLARTERRVVLLNLPLAHQSEDLSADQATPSVTAAKAEEPESVDGASLDRLVSVLRTARRPVFVAGRGARGPGCREALETLAERSGALLATSAVVKGLFNKSPWSLDVSGGFSSPLAAELITNADLIIGWGCALNMWTMRHGRLIAEDATVVQVDIDADALGAHRDITFGITADVRNTAQRATELLKDVSQEGYRTPQIQQKIAGGISWRSVPYRDMSGDGQIDPRTLCLTLDDILPKERVVGVDSGNFMGYPSMFLQVPDEYGFCFTQAFQSVGLGLATAIGAALAQPSRLPIAALGDGGALMGASELETVVRLGLPMVIVIFNDQAFGAEVHHFRSTGHPLSTVSFPDTDFAAVAQGFGFDAVTVREPNDLDAVKEWVKGNRSRPLLIDAKVTKSEPSWWLSEAFGH